MSKAPSLCALSLFVAVLCAAFAGCEVSTDSSSQAASQPAKTEIIVPGPSAEAARVARGYLKFVEGYKTGYEKALRDSRPMLVFFTAEWCHFCHQMADEAFTHDQVVSLSERFVCILVDADSEPEVCKQFRVQGFPTIQFISPRGVPLNRIVGKKPGHQLMMAMQAALQTVARRTDASGEVKVR